MPNPVQIYSTPEEHTACMFYQSAELCLMLAKMLKNQANLVKLGLT